MREEEEEVLRAGAPQAGQLFRDIWAPHSTTFEDTVVTKVI